MIVVEPRDTVQDVSVADHLGFGLVQDFLENFMGKAVQWIESRFGRGRRDNNLLRGRLDDDGIVFEGNHLLF